jgi:hypothetical protein
MQQLEMLEQSQKAQRDMNRQVFTWLGDITGWRKLKNDKKREQILSGRAKIFNLLDRFQSN